MHKKKEEGKKQRGSKRKGKERKEVRKEERKGGREGGREEDSILYFLTYPSSPQKEAGHNDRCLGSVKGITREKLEQR